MSVIDIIKHYQRSIEKYNQDEKRVLHCIGKLNNLPIKVNHLEETGVGRTVNSLRKHDGQTGNAARALVAKWKEMVASAESSHSEQEQDEENENADSDNEQLEIQEDKNDYVQNEVDNYRDESQEEEEEEEKVVIHKHSSSKKHRHKEKKRHHEQIEDDQKSEHNKKKLSSSLSKNHSDVHDEHKKHKKKDKEEKHKKHHNSEKKHKSESKERPEKHKEKKSKQPEPEEKSVEEEVVVKKHKHKSSKHHHSSKSDSLEVPKKHKSDKATSSTSPIKKDTSTTAKRKLVDIDMMAVNNDHESSDEEGIDSFSGTSFADALGMSSPVKKKPKPTKSQPSTPSSSAIKDEDSSLNLLTPGVKLPQLNLDINLPTITPDYRPLPSSETLWSLSKKKEEQIVSLTDAITSKNQRTKVYSGNKAAYGYVPSLFELCIRILQDNIDALAYTGGVPYSILLPVLERATPEQLFMLEHHNAYLLEDTDNLWEHHCRREFRGKQRAELESWREAYTRFLNEREEKLRALTSNIRQNIDKSVPVRQTKLAYVDSVAKPPRGVARKQAKFGTAGAVGKPLVTPAARVASLAHATGSVSVPNPGARAVSHSGSISKPKKAPLMQKTLALIKSTNRYRR